MKQEMKRKINTHMAQENLFHCIKFEPCHSDQKKGLMHKALPPFFFSRQRILRKILRTPVLVSSHHMLLYFALI